MCDLVYFRFFSPEYDSTGGFNATPILPTIYEPINNAIEMSKASSVLSALLQMTYSNEKTTIKFNDKKA